MLLATGHGLPHQYRISVAETGTSVYGGSLREHPGFSAPVSPVFPAAERSRRKKKPNALAGYLCRLLVCVSERAGNSVIKFVKGPKRTGR